MNTASENEPTDEQLDAMLRDVQIPADLKSRLKQIPDSLPSTEQQTIRSPARTSSKAPWFSYLLAASLLAAATFATTRFLSKNNRPAAPESVATTAIPGPENDLISKDLMIADSNSESNAQDQQLQKLQAEIQELEIARLESELLRLQSLDNARLSQHEVESVIMALAPEHSINLGGKESYVRSELARVQTQYPNTRGAALAGKILQEIN